MNDTEKYYYRKTSRGDISLYKSIGDDDDLAIFYRIGNSWFRIFYFDISLLKPISKAEAFALII